MSTPISDNDGIKTATLSGEIDGSNAPDLQEELIAKLGDAKKVILDFSQVTYLSSAGLRLLLALTRLVQENGGSLVLAGVADPIREVMEQTGFLSHFKLAADLEDAVQLVNA